jgi:hypothetical protein
MVNAPISSGSHLRAMKSPTRTTVACPAAVGSTPAEGGGGLMGDSRRLWVQSSMVEDEVLLHIVVDTPWIVGL